MQPPAVIHGDYKLDNVMFAPRLPVELVAVVDWEQSTIGDPLVDLGWVLGLWIEAGRARVARRARRRSREARRRARRAASSRRATPQQPDRDLSNLAFYCVLGLFKLACVMEGSFARFRAGTSDDAYFAALETRRPRARAPRPRVRGGGASDGPG